MSNQIDKSQIKSLADQLIEKLSDPKANLEEIASLYIVGDLDAEAIVRMAHGNNMNVVYRILCDFKENNKKEG